MDAQSPELGSCIGYRVEGPYIVVENGCSEPVHVEAIEVHYTIVTHRYGLPHERLHGRREIKERISVGKTINPGGVVDIYFGPSEQLEEVYVILRRDDREYRVEARPIEKEQQR